MKNEAQGIKYQQTAHISVPRVGMDQRPVNVSIAGNIKFSSSLFHESRPLDPSERANSIGATWANQIIKPVPVFDSELSNISVLISGSWKFCDLPPENYWQDEVEPFEWDDVAVPGELMAMGYDIKRNNKYVYKKRLEIPAEWIGRTILLKFGMAYEYVKIWVDGNYVRDHKGAFTSFDCDITNYVKAGEGVWLTVMCMHSGDALCDWVDKSNAEAGGYAGLIDDVEMVALPKAHLSRFFYETDFDEAYTNAFLKVTVAIPDSFYNDTLDCDKNSRILVTFHLYDSQDMEIPLEDAVIYLDGEKLQDTVIVPVAAPAKWDSEHPNLYRLEAILTANEKEKLKYNTQVGFRKIERKGNNLYINGMKTKLRGACLYGHDPILGKVFTKEQLETIVKAAKWANINYLRSSAYPERAALYELCDMYGIYVEECAPVNFQRGMWDSQRDLKYRPASNLPSYTDAVMNQFAEMIERDRNHPSIIIWEYGNESDWGINFQAELDFLEKEEPTRLTAGTWDNTKTSLASYHYPQFDEIIPNAALYDEYAHVATHATETLKRDPGIRNAWGLSILKGWDALYDADGVVGAAIFAMSDYTIQRPDGKVFAAEYGQWGLVDGWLREKPELWLTKKGYSPVKLPEKYISKPGKNMHLAIPVRNRYNHTNLQEILFCWSVGIESGELYGPCVAPSQSGALLLPAREWVDGEKLHIQVYEKKNELVDEYLLTVGSETISRQYDYPVAVAPVLEEDELFISIIGDEFSIIFSKDTGLIVKGEYRGESIINSGPYLNLYGAYYKPSVFQNDRYGEFKLKSSDWRCDEFRYELEENDVVVYISGRYPGGSHRDMWEFEYGFEPVHVSFIIRINRSGLITTDYVIKNPPKEYIFEVGVAYVLSDEIDTLTWEKSSVFSVYPKDHIGRPLGIAKRYRGYGKDEYRCLPEWKWSEDEINYTLYDGLDQSSHGTNDFLATREQIWYASAILSGQNERVRVESDGKSLAVRVHPAQDEDEDLPGGIKLTMNTGLYYDLGHGSSAIVKSGDGYMGNYTYSEIHLTDGYRGSVKMRLTDNDAYQS